MRAIMLKRQDFREYDQMISFYSEDWGKMEVLARGVKKINSKNSAYLEPFFLVDLETVAGTEIKHLTKIQPINSFKKIRKDFNKSRLAWYTVELLDKTISPESKEEKIFFLLNIFLEFLDDAPKVGWLLAPAFAIKYFSALGFEPRLDVCVVGGEDINETDKNGFYFSGGGIVCPRCYKQKKGNGELLADLPSAMDRTLRFLLESSWYDINDLPVNPTIKSIHDLIYQFAVFHSQRKIDKWPL